MKVRFLLAIVFLISLLLSPLSSVAQDKLSWSVYFSSHGGCTDPIIRELNKAQTTILVQSYSFTSASIAKALLDAHLGIGKCLTE